MAVTRLHYAKWGARQVSGASAYGVVVSFEKIEDAMVQTENEEDGSVCRAVPYDSRVRIVFCVQTDARTRPPSTGSRIVVDNEIGWVQHAETIEQNTAFRKIRVTMERYKNCDTPG